MGTDLGQDTPAFAKLIWFQLRRAVLQGGSHFRSESCQTQDGRALGQGEWSGRATTDLK